MGIKTIRECIHCAREFHSIKDKFCSNDCIKETAT